MSLRAHSKVDSGAGWAPIGAEGGAAAATADETLLAGRMELGSSFSTNRWHSGVERAGGYRQVSQSVDYGWAVAH